MVNVIRTETTSSIRFTIHSFSWSPSFGCGYRFSNVIGFHILSRWSCSLIKQTLSKIGPTSVYFTIINIHHQHECTVELATTINSSLVIRSCLIDSSRNICLIYTSGTHQYGWCIFMRYKYIII